MAVGQRAGEMERFIRSDQQIAFEDAAEAIDLFSRPVGEVGEGTFVDAAGLAEAFAQEDGGWGVAVGDRLHVHGNMISQYFNKYKTHISYYMGT
jgi:hypothetical protein